MPVGESDSLVLLLWLTLDHFHILEGGCMHILPSILLRATTKQGLKWPTFLINHPFRATEPKRLTIPIIVPISTEEREREHKERKLKIRTTFIACILSYNEDKFKKVKLKFKKKILCRRFFHQLSRRAHSKKI